jgi:pimeloyl-ACP methyl ester carboxylesterase
MLTRQQKRTLLTIVKFVVPTVLIFLVVTGVLVAYTIHHLTHPPKTKQAAKPEDYTRLGIWLPTSDESWSLKGEDKGSGWLLRASTGAPAIILSHSYGHNQADLLSLGVALQRAGYHVLLYDLRGHGESKVELSSLGEYEADDILNAIEHLKSLKDQDGKQLVDKDRIGLYGVSVGGYASLIAASKDPTVKAIAVDAVYPDVPHYVKSKLKDLSGIESGFIEYVTNLGMSLYFSNKYGQSSAKKAVSNFSEVKQLYIMGKDAGDMLANTGDVYNQAPPFKEAQEVPHSRTNILYKNDQDVYDPVVVEFFRRPDVLPPIPGQTQPLNAKKSGSK